MLTQTARYLVLLSSPITKQDLNLFAAYLVETEGIEPSILQCHRNVFPLALRPQIIVTYRPCLINRQAHALSQCPQVWSTPVRSLLEYVTVVGRGERIRTFSVLIGPSPFDHPYDFGDPTGTRTRFTS